MHLIINRQPKQDEADEKFLNTFVLEQRSEELRKSLDLKRKDIIKEFFSCFIKHDKEKTRALTIRKVFQEIIKLQKENKLVFKYNMGFKDVNF